ncbi:MAG: glycosyl hydrolase family 17 protein [Gammaproteobacteria bacterium]
MARILGRASLAPQHMVGRHLAALTALAVICVIAIWRNGQPVALPDVPAGKLACISYTPRSDVSMPVGSVSKHQIEADLKLLEPETRCIRTYSSTHGMEAVPDVARAHGLRILLGIWIGNDAASNDAEINAALATARVNADIVDGIIVGNEVLLRHEQTPETLRAYIERVRAATKIAVTYADVWEFWRRNPSLSNAVDFITIHILPYWEDEPVAVEEALQHVRDIHAQMQSAFPDKRLLIGETGWPTQGRQREGAKPSTVNAARFVREFVAYANASKLPYNIIEAFDQPWKRANEGTVGGYWGLYGTGGESKFPLQGSVVEDSNWHGGALLAAASGTLFLFIGYLPGYARDIRVRWMLVACGVASGVLAYAQWHYQIAANRDAFEWIQSLTGAACGWVLALGLTFSLARLKDDESKSISLIAGVEAFDRLCRRLCSLDSVAIWPTLLSALRLAFLFGVAYISLGLTLDGRYRDFPLALTILPALMLILNQLGSDMHKRGRVGSEEKILAAVIIACAITTVFIEGIHNRSALVWVVLCLLIGASTLIAAHSNGTADIRTRQQ